MGKKNKEPERTEEEKEEEEEVQEKKKSGNYFLTEKKNLDFFSSGCVVLDCILGGGWPLKRISNIVGDKSTGKTLLAIEACANFYKNWPKGRIKYYEQEAAFDTDYAKVLGFPISTDEEDEEEKGIVEFIEDVSTVEELFEDLEQITQEQEKNPEPVLAIIDSLDALSDKTELESKMEDGTYGVTKPKKLSQLFRRLAKKVKTANMHIMFISQIRDKIGVRFGEKYSRSGGHGLDFYASQVIWLSEIKKIKTVSKKIERVTGIEVQAKCKKNKVGPPFRICEFPIMFYYGVDDVIASLNWLKEIKALDELGISEKEIRTVAETIKDPENGKELKQELDRTVTRLWYQIESDFMPKFKKY